MDTTNTAKKSLTLFRKGGRIRMNQSYTAPQMPYTYPPGLVERPPRLAASRDFFCLPFFLCPIATPLKREWSSSVNYFALRKKPFLSAPWAGFTKSGHKSAVAPVRQKNRANFAQYVKNAAGQLVGRPRRAERLFSGRLQLECGAGQISHCGISRTMRIHYIGEISSAECKHISASSSRGNIRA